MASLYQVVYYSRSRLRPASTDGPAGEIEKLLATSRRNNARDDITGGLLFSDNCFAQALEGPIEQVGRTFERIQQDERHGAIVVLQAKQVPQRSFANWNMAYAAPDIPLADKLLSANDDRQHAGSDSVLELLRTVLHGKTA